MSELVRTHVMLPRDLIEAADRIVGERKRSELLTELLTTWLRRERQKEAVRAVLEDTQPLDDDVPPEWLTAEGAARWVHDGRQERATVAPRFSATRAIAGDRRP